MSLKLNTKDVFGSDILSPIPRPSQKPAQGRRRPRGGTSRINFDNAFRWEKPIPINTRDIHNELRKFTNPSEKRLSRWLFSTWNAQASDIKQQEIRNAFRDGSLSSGVVDKWRQEYASVINDVMVPEWETGALRGGDYMASRIADTAGISWNFPDSTRRIKEWIDQNSARLVVELTTEQQRAVNAVIKQLVAREGSSATELAKVLRPIVGLTERDALAVTRRRALMKSRGLAGTRLDNAADKYSDFLLRKRATRIARTETSAAFNFGTFEGVRESVAPGGPLSGSRVFKIFDTADDERVCPFCGGLDGEIVGLEQTFPAIGRRTSNTYVPPVHPQCRCAIRFEVVDVTQIGGGASSFSSPLPTNIIRVTDDNAFDIGLQVQEANIKLRGVGTNATTQQVNAGKQLSSAYGHVGDSGFRLLAKTGDDDILQGLISYRTQAQQGVWEMTNLGSASGKGSQVGAALFEQMARDAIAHNVGLTWVAPPGSKGFFRKLKVVPVSKGETIFRMSAAEVKTWAQKRGVPKGRTIGKPKRAKGPKTNFNKPVPIPVRVNPPKPSLSLEPRARTEGFRTVAEWEPAADVSEAKNRIKRHFTSVKVDRKHIKAVSGDTLTKQQELEYLNLIDYELVNMEEAGWIDNRRRLSTLELSPNGVTKGNNWNGQHSTWGDLDSAKTNFKKADIRIDISTLNDLPSKFRGKTLADSIATANKETAGSNPGKRWSLSAGTNSGPQITFRHEMGHAVSVPVRNAEWDKHLLRPGRSGRIGFIPKWNAQWAPRDNIKGESLWQKWEDTFKKLGGSNIKGTNKTGKIFKSVSQYSTTDSKEFYAECFARVLSPDFIPGSLDADTGIEGFEALMKAIAETVQG